MGLKPNAIIIDRGAEVKGRGPVRPVITGLKHGITAILACFPG
jgi:hypothetical protein